MTKEIEDAYVAGWQTALEDIMSSVEEVIREVVTNFNVPEEFASEKKPESKLIVPEKKLVLPQ